MLRLEDLQGKRGKLELLVEGLPTAGGYVDISDADWSAFVALQGLEVTKARLIGKEINVDFAESRFEDCHFAGLRSVGHFWGHANSWMACRFSKVELQSAICPRNRFHDCAFEETRLEGAKLHETTLEQCRFVRCIFEGLAIAAPGVIRRDTPQALRDRKVSVLFDGCTFIEPVFRHCRFNGIGFDRCVVDSPRLEECDFTGAAADKPWWPMSAGDPFLGFLADLIDLIEGRLGPSSAALLAMKQYASDYRSGKVKSKDYSACLYEGSVPDSELEQIEGSMERLEKKFGW